MLLYKRQVSCEADSLYWCPLNYRNSLFPLVFHLKQSFTSRNLQTLQTTIFRTYSTSESPGICWGFHASLIALRQGDYVIAQNNMCLGGMSLDGSLKKPRYVLKLYELELHRRRMAFKHVLVRSLLYQESIVPLQTLYIPVAWIWWYI